MSMGQITLKFGRATLQLQFQVNIRLEGLLMITLQFIFHQFMVQLKPHLIL